MEVAGSDQPPLRISGSGWMCGVKVCYSERVSRWRHLTVYEFSNERIKKGGSGGTKFWWGQGNPVVIL